MSRGLGKVQSAIHGLLTGKLKLQCYATGNLQFDTSELLEELIAAGVINDRVSRKVQMATVVRSCGLLTRRGLVKGTYAFDMNNAGRTTIRWEAGDGRKKS